MSYKGATPHDYLVEWSLGNTCVNISPWSVIGMNFKRLLVYAWGPFFVRIKRKKIHHEL